MLQILQVLSQSIFHTTMMDMETSLAVLDISPVIHGLMHLKSTTSQNQESQFNPSLFQTLVQENYILLTLDG